MFSGDVQSRLLMARARLVLPFGQFNDGAQQLEAPRCVCRFRPNLLQRLMSDPTHGSGATLTLDLSALSPIKGQEGGSAWPKMPCLGLMLPQAAHESV